jgi:hypothetical protein
MIDENIAELLYIYDQPVYVSDQSENNEFAPVGGFEKKILVALKEADFTADNEALLVKMLSACQLTDKDYFIIRIMPQQLLTLINRYQPETVLLFDLSLHSETFNSLKEKYKPFRFAGKKFLLCDSLTAISTAPSLKSALWTNGLKPLFKIN